MHDKMQEVRDKYEVVADFTLTPSKAVHKIEPAWPGSRDYILAEYLDGEMEARIFLSPENLPGILELLDKCVLQHTYGSTSFSVNTTTACVVVCYSFYPGNRNMTHAKFEIVTLNKTYPHVKEIHCSKTKPPSKASKGSFKLF